MREIISKQSVDRLAKGATLWDGEVKGFFARRLPSGTVSFGFRYWHGAKHPLLSLGTLGSVTPAEARKLAKAAAGKVAAGRDPQGEKVAHRARVENSVNKVIDTFMERHVRAKSLRSADAIAAVFANHVRDVLGSRSVYDVGLEDINPMLDRVEDEAGAGAAQNVLQYLRQALAFWMLRDPKFRSPIPAVRGLARIRKSERARTRTLNDTELADLWCALAEIGDEVTARFVKALVLSGRRRSELAGMQWSEVQGDAWIIPAGRMKNKAEFVQPITSAFRALMGEPGTGYVFSRDGRRGFAGFSRHKARLDRAIAVLCEREGRSMPSPWVWHDLRRSARSLMSRAGVPADHAERALAHVIGGVRGVCDRHSYQHEKADALNKLAALVARIVDPPAADVVYFVKKSEG